MPDWLCESALPGVGAKLGCFLSGDSGRGRDGLLGLKEGLDGRAPGPTDCEKDGLTAGVVDCSPFLGAPYDGVVGVPVVEVDEDRFSAR